MTIKNEISQRCDSPERKSFLTLSFKLCSLVLIVCISASSGRAESLLKDIFPFNLAGFPFAPGSQDENTSNIPEHSNAPFRIRPRPLQIAKLPSDQGQTQTDSSIAADFAEQVDKKSSYPLIAKSPTTHLGRQLWQARIDAPEDKSSSQHKNKLQQMIRQIRSVEFKPQEPTTKTFIVVEPVPKAEPNEISTDTEMLRESGPGKIEHKPPYEKVTDETLQIFKSLSQHPEQLHNPLELAEILFNSHCLPEAAKCYRQALDRTTAGKTGQVPNGDWLLFQTGNCLRNDDPPAAMRMYQQVLAEYPDSPWADLAKTKSELIDWYLKDTPYTLIDECKLSAL